ncbi:MAG TPA: alginate export family protein [Gemmatimonadaceae bacterium]|nr:alginate export family protein [Gemmatimonadaceae bacterium]
MRIPSSPAAPAHRAAHQFVRAAGLVLACSALAARARAQQATVPTPVTLSGELRARSEWDRPGGGAAEDVYTYLRTRLGVGATPTDGVRLFFQLQDSRVYGVPTSAAAGNPDITDLHQAYVDLSTHWRATAVTTRVGRQEVAFGNERLVGPVGWSNTGRTFDGARVLLAPSQANGAAGANVPWSATLFVATVEERGRHFGPAASPPAGGYPADRAVAGAWLTRTKPAGTLDLTLLYDAGSKYRTYAESNRYTLDARFRTPASAPVGIDAEAAWQGGTQTYEPSATTSVGQDVSAWLAGVRIGALPGGARTKTAFVGVDVLSGDATPANGSYHAFNTMYATNHPFYGLMDLFLDPAARTNDAGLVDVFGSASTTAGVRTSLRADVHRFAVQAGHAGEIGWELDLVAPIRLSGAASLELGATTFRASAAAAAMGLGADGDYRHWGYLQLRAAF